MEASTSPINAAHANDDADDFFDPAPESADLDLEAPTEPEVEPAEAPNVVAVEPEPEPEPEPAEKKRGTPERPYVVLQQMELTQPMLESMLTALKKGEAPLSALFRVHNCEARNSEHAIRLAWSSREFGDEAHLGALTERNLKIHHVKPQKVETVSLTIA